MIYPPNWPKCFPRIAYSALLRTNRHTDCPSCFKGTTEQSHRFHHKPQRAIQTPISVLLKRSVQTLRSCRTPLTESFAEKHKPLSLLPYCLILFDVLFDRRPRPVAMTPRLIHAASIWTSHLLSVTNFMRRFAKKQVENRREKQEWRKGKCTKKEYLEDRMAKRRKWGK